MDELRNEAKNCLSFISREGILPDGMGTYRIHLPVLDLPTGRCVAFCHAESRSRKLKSLGVKNKYFFWSRPSTSVSWKGMAISSFSSAFEGGEPCFVEIDLTSLVAGTIAVNRNEFKFSEIGRDLIKKSIRKAITQLFKDFLAANKSSCFHTLNSALLGFKVENVQDLYWFQQETNAKAACAYWQKISFPAISGEDLSFVPAAFSWQKKNITVLPQIDNLHASHPNDTVVWSKVAPTPNRIWTCDSWISKSARAWFSIQTSPQKASASFPQTVQFPPEWENLCGVSFRNYVAWNSENTIVKAVTKDSWNYVYGIDLHGVDPLIWKNDFLNDRTKASAWILRFLNRDEKDLWEGLVARDPAFIKSLFKLVLGSTKARNETPIMFVGSRGFLEEELRILLPNGWETEPFGKKESRLPTPSSEWRINYQRAT